MISSLANVVWGKRSVEMYFSSVMLYSDKGDISCWWKFGCESL